MDKPTPTREQWREHICWAISVLSSGGTHHVRKGETWDTAILRVAAGSLSKQGMRLPIVDVPKASSSGSDTWPNNAERVLAVLDEDRLKDLWEAARAGSPTNDGKVQGRHGRIQVPMRRGWGSA